MKVNQLRIKRGWITNKSSSKTTKRKELTRTKWQSENYKKSKIKAKRNKKRGDIKNQNNKNRRAVQRSQPITRDCRYGRVPAPGCHPADIATSVQGMNRRRRTITKQNDASDIYCVDRVRVQTFPSLLSLRKYAISFPPATCASVHIRSASTAVATP